MLKKKKFFLKFFSQYFLKIQKKIPWATQDPSASNHNKGNDNSDNDNDNSKSNDNITKNDNYKICGRFVGVFE